MSLLPKEHGAYGQLALPLVTALASAGPSVAGLCFVAAVVAAFLAHEPAAILLGSRGARARRELGARASAWLWSCVLITALASGATLVLIGAAARWSLVLPLAPALVLAIAGARGREKSWYAELAAAVAFSLAAVPVSLAAGAPLEAAAVVAIPFAVFFATSTLAVRVVILRVRGGGRPAAAAATRAAVFLLVSAAVVTLAVLGFTGALPFAVLVATTPGLATAAMMAARPPAPIYLRTMGWTLVGVSIATSAIVVTVTRAGL